MKTTAQVCQHVTGQVTSQSVNTQWVAKISLVGHQCTCAARPSKVFVWGNTAHESGKVKPVRYLMSESCQGEETDINIGSNRSHF